MPPVQQVSPGSQSDMENKLPLKRTKDDLDHMTPPELQNGKRFKGKHKSLNFNSLPLECQLHVFSYLTVRDKCQASCTCKTWRDILCSPNLWTVADFTHLMCCELDGLAEKVSFGRIRENETPLPVRNHTCCPTSSESFTSKVSQFVNFLCDRNAQLKILSFEFDLFEEKEMWLYQMNKLLKATNSVGLTKVFGRWSFTPHFMIKYYRSSLDDKHTRVGSFQKLLKTLHETSPYVQHFRIQFDWSMTSVELLCKFQQIHTLELSKYWVFVRTLQSAVDALLDGLPNLKRLHLEMISPFQLGSSHQLYTLRSATLEELDIRRSPGFFLLSVNLPKLRCFSSQRETWAGPVLSRDYLNIPCLHTILMDGAHNLANFNGFPLGSDWRTRICAVFEQKLKSSCYCPKHKKGNLFL